MWRLCVGNALETSWTIENGIQAEELQGAQGAVQMWFQNPHGEVGTD
jgi:hypothetical protein